ncbi:MAG: TonB-dependent receptor [Bacteroidaceae bacterium]|nr:TonB-dependent receptor [Bacteroidaceae bacterium]
MRHIIIYIGVCLCAVSPTISAQVHQHSDCLEDSINPMKEAILSEVTVQGIAGVQRLKDAASPFMVVTPKQLHVTLGTNIVDAVGHLPGLSQISTGAGISKPVIRGLGYNRVVVVDQGIRQEGQQWGDEHGLEVDEEGVHSVEVLKGPASLMYGSDAIAGVMILHPEHPLEEGTMQVKVGSQYQSNNGLYDYRVGFAGNIDGWLWNWHFLNKAAHDYKNSADGYVPGSRFKERDVQGMFGLNRSWGHSWLRFSHVNFTPSITEGELVGSNFDGKSYSIVSPFQKVLHTKAVSDNAWYFGNGTLKAILGYQQNYRREYEEEEEAELAMRLHTFNYDIKYLHTLPHDWKLSTGIGGMWQRNMNQGEEYLIPDYRLFDFGFFATAEWEWQKWHFSGGARIDNRHLSTSALEEDGELRFEELRKNFTGVTGSLGAVWNVTDKLNLRLNAARGFRAPTVSELSSNGVHEGSIQYELGNADLKAEKSTQLDFGLDYTSHYVNIQASLFCNWIDDYVFLSRLPFRTDGFRTYQYQQGDARLMGGEVSIDLHPVNPLHIENAFSFVRGVQTSSGSASKEEGSDRKASLSEGRLEESSVGRSLPMMPAPRWTCNVRYEFPDLARRHLRRTFLSAGMECNLRQSKFYAVDDTETPTPGYAIFNLSAGTDLHIFGHNCIELTFSCQNLFDKVYQPHLSRLKYIDTDPSLGRQGISAMGRNFCIKVSIPIDIHLK